MAPRAVTSPLLQCSWEAPGWPLVQGCLPDHNHPVCSGSALVSLDECRQLLEVAMLPWAHSAPEPHPEPLALAGSGTLRGPWASTASQRNLGRLIPGGQAGNWKRFITDTEALS